MNSRKSITVLLNVVCWLTSIGFAYAAVFAVTIQEENENSQQQRIDSLNRDAKRLQQEVEFSCSYGYERGRSESWDAAWAEATSDCKSIAQNRVTKQGPDLSLFLKNDEGEPSLKLLAFDGMEIVVSPQRKSMTVIGPESSRQIDRFMGHGEDSIMFSPFYLQGGAFGKVVEPLFATTPIGVEASTSVVDKDDGKIVVTFDATSEKPNYSANSEYTFQSFDGVWLLVEHAYQEVHDGKPGLRSRMKLSDFVKCGNIHLASKMARVMESFQTLNRDSTGFKYWKWQSKDLGQRPPNEADFQFVMPEDVRLEPGLTLPANRIVDQALLTSWLGIIRESQRENE